MRARGGFKCVVHIRSFDFYVRANATVLFLERSTISHSAAARLSILSRRKTFPTTSEAILSPFSPMRTRKTSPSVKMYRPMLSRCQGTSQFVLPVCPRLSFETTHLFLKVCRSSFSILQAVTVHVFLKASNVNQTQTLTAAVLKSCASSLLQEGQTCIGDH